MPVTRRITYSKVELFVTVDEEDVYLLDEYTWCAYRNRNTYYACARTKVGGIRVTLSLHRLILNAPDGVKVDHRDGNGLNCVRSNLRLATDGQNAQNSRHPVGKTGYRGVRKPSRGKGYYAQIKLNVVLQHLGTYPTSIEAAVAYDTAAVQLHGDFAVVNFPC